MDRVSERLSPTIYNVTLTNADAEYSQVLSKDCRAFTFQCRTAVEVRFAFVIGKVAAPTAPYATMKAGATFGSPEKFSAEPNGLTLYLASGTAGAVVEIVEYV